jgi:hypothetical protein
MGNSNSSQKPVTRQTKIKNLEDKISRNELRLIILNICKEIKESEVDILIVNTETEIKSDKSKLDELIDDLIEVSNQTAIQTEQNFLY